MTNQLARGLEHWQNSIGSAPRTASRALQSVSKEALPDLPPLHVSCRAPNEAVREPGIVCI